MKVASRIVLVMTLACVSPGNAIEVPIIVQEPAGIAREAEPISGGIALPPKMFRPGEARFALFDGDKPIPAQVSELVVGARGFVRWVLLDFQLDLDENETKTLTLKTGQAAMAKHLLEVAETEDSVRVDTGRIAFAVSKKTTFGLVENVTVGGKATVSGGGVSYVDGLDDKRYQADTPELVRLHYAGPLRVTMEVRGKFKGDKVSRLGYCTYITAWAGRGDILVRHSLINSRDDQMYFVKIKSSRIELKPATTGGPIIVGAGEPATVGGGGEVLLHQGLEEQRNRVTELPCLSMVT